jgi:hypothetical protein
MFSTCCRVVKTWEVVEMYRFNMGVYIFVFLVLLYKFTSGISLEGV